MNIIISNTSGKPIYQQIYDSLSAQIIKGELPGDTCLPPIRTIAKELRISIITVKRAWEELEHSGLIYSIQGKGCFVAQHATEELDLKRYETTISKLKKDIEYYKSIGITKKEIIDLISKYY